MTIFFSKTAEVVYITICYRLNLGLSDEQSVMSEKANGENRSLHLGDDDGYDNDTHDDQN